MIVDVIKEVAMALSQNPSFFHGEKWEQNLQDEQTRFPLVMLDHPILAKDRMLNSGNAETTYNLSILFGNKIPYDAIQDQRQPNLDAMYDMKREFIIRLGKHPLVADLINATTLEVFRLKDLSVDGLYLQLGVILVDDKAVCLTEWLVDNNGNYILDSNGNKIPKGNNSNIFDGFWLKITEDAYLVFDEYINGSPTGYLLYSKKQELKINNNGCIASKYYDHVLSPTIAISGNAIDLQVTADGQVYEVTQSGSNLIAQIQVAIFQTPSGLQDIGNGFFKETMLSGTPIVGLPAQFPNFRNNKIVYYLN